MTPQTTILNWLSFKITHRLGHGRARARHRRCTMRIGYVIRRVIGHTGPHVDMFFKIVPFYALTRPGPSDSAYLTRPQNTALRASFYALCTASPPTPRVHCKTLNALQNITHRCHDCPRCPEKQPDALTDALARKHSPLTLLHAIHLSIAIQTFETHTPSHALP